MFQKITQAFKKNLFTLITLLVVLSGMYAYMYVFVPSNEHRINASKFRVLTSLNDNIRYKYEVLSSLAANISHDTSATRDIFEKYKENPYSLDTAYATEDSLNNMGIVYARALRMNNDTAARKIKTPIVIKWEANKFFGTLMQHQFDACLIVRDENIIYNSNPSIEIKVSNFNNLKEGLISSSMKGSVPTKKSADSLLADDFPAFSSSAMKDVDVGGETYKAFMLPVKNLNGQQLILCGLYSLSRYEHEAKRVSDSTLYLLLFLTALFLLSMPFIKLMTMNEVDRLGSWDLAQVIGSTMIVAVVFTTTFLYLKTLNDKTTQETLQKNEAIASNILSSFKKDIDKACASLIQCDSRATISSGEITHNLIYFKNIKTLIEQKVKAPKTKNFVRDSTNFFIDKFDKTLKRYFWLNRKGEQIFTWVTSMNDLSGGNFANRNYFMRITANQPDYHYKNADGSFTDFSIEPLISWRTATYRTVLCKRSGRKEESVACVSIIPTSVTQAIMPEGYAYVVIDKTGKVVYSSDSTRNQNENFLSECENSDLFVSAIRSQIKTTISETIYGSEHTAIIQPCFTSGLYLVVLANQDNTNLCMEQTILYTYSCTLALFIFIVLLLLVIHLVKKRFAHDSINAFSLDWLWPVRTKEEGYFRVLRFNAALIVFSLLLLLAVFIGWLPVASLTTLLLRFFFIQIIFVAGYTYYQFNVYHKRDDAHKEYKFLSQWGRAVVVLIILSAYHDPAGMAMLAVLTIFVVLIKKFTNAEGERVKKYREKSARFNFSALIFLSWATLTCIIPSAAFFIHAYNEANLRQLKDGQIHYAENFKPGKYFPEITDAHFKTDSNRTHTQIISLRADTLKKYVGPENEISDIADDTVYEYIIRRTRSMMNDEAKNTLYLSRNVSDNQQDTMYHWVKTDSSLKFSASYLNGAPTSGIMRLRIESLPLQFSFLSKPLSDNFIFLLVSLLFVALGYSLVRYLLMRFFNTDLQIIDIKNIQIESILKDEKNYKQVFINGIPGCGKFKRVIDEVMANTKNYEVINLFDIPDSIKPDENINDAQVETLFKINKNSLNEGFTFIIRHFEYDFKNRNSNRIKLKLIERLMSARVRVIIVSDIDPVSFLRSYTQFDTATDANEVQLIKKDIDRWAKLLGNFYNYYDFTIQENNTREIIHAETDFRKRLLMSECRFGNFLPHIKTRLENDAALMSEGTTGEILRHIQTYAHLYYHSIWNSLTKEEQYLVYDIAQDGLINTKNSYGIKTLMEKGLLINDLGYGKITLLNESFRLFILTQIKKSEALIIEKNMSDEGRWGNFRMPIIIIIAALVIFLLSTQQNPLNSVLSYAGMFLTGVSLLQRTITGWDALTSKVPKA